jgi:hypothetical protein
MKTAGAKCLEFHGSFCLGETFTELETHKIRKSS